MIGTILAILGILGANGFERSFDRAAKAYEAGDFSAAIAVYEQLIAEDVVHPAVFYNLGNAHYRMGQIGRAIANYERALQIDPGFENARLNLAQAVGKTQRGLNRAQPAQWEQSLFFWHYGLAPRTIRTRAIVFWFAFWVSLAVRQWRRLRYLGYLVVASGVLALLFGGSAWVKAHPEAPAVAVENTVPVYFGTDENGAKHFELYDGDRVTVDRRERGWARVTVADGKRGWARDEGLVFVGPPYHAPKRDHETGNSGGGASS